MFFCEGVIGSFDPDIIVVSTDDRVCASKFLEVEESAELSIWVKAFGFWDKFEEFSTIDAFIVCILYELEEFFCIHNQSLSFDA